jgi:hypothetical protein
MENNTYDLNKEDALTLIQHFKGKLVTDEVLLEYCNLNHMQPITAGVYSDLLFQYNYDVRVSELVPKVLALLQQYKHIPEFSAQADREAQAEINRGLADGICLAIEDSGMLYTEVDVFVGYMGDILKGLVQEAGRGANNMAARALKDNAEKQFGSPLTVKALANADRERAGAGKRV